MWIGSSRRIRPLQAGRQPCLSPCILPREYGPRERSEPPVDTTSSTTQTLSRSAGCVDLVDDDDLFFICRYRFDFGSDRIFHVSLRISSHDIIHSQAHSHRCVSGRPYFRADQHVKILYIFHLIKAHPRTSRSLCVSKHHEGRDHEIRPPLPFSAFLRARIS